MTLGVRSEDVAVGADGQVEAKVHHVENHGVEKIVTLRVDEHLIRATVPATLPVSIDAPCASASTARRCTASPAIPA